MRDIKLLLLLFWLSRAIAAPAQTPAYLHYTVRDGLPGNLVYCGLQDQRGLIWFGTDKGLACFDGIRFRVYGVADGLPDPEVLGMKEDHYGRIWIFTFRQKPCYLLNGRIITEKEDPLLAKIDFGTGTYGFTEDKKGAIWMSEHSQTVYRLTLDSLRKFVFPKAVIRMLEIDSTMLAFGIEHIQRIDSAYHMVPEYNMNQDLFKYPGIGMNISGNRFLYVYTNRLLLLEWSGGKIRELGEMAAPTGQVQVDRRGRFWYCSPAIGAICFDNTRRDLSNPVTYLAGKKVNNMFEDNQGTIWFSTLDEGVFALRKNAPVLFFSDAKSPSRNIRSVARAPDGRILAGDDLGNVHIIQNGRAQTVPFSSIDGYNLVRRIVPEGNSRFWIATDEGLYACTYKDRNSQHLLSIYSIKDIMLENDRLWHVSNGRLGYVDTKTLEINTWRLFRHTTLGIDSEGCVWAGGLGGLYSEADSFKVLRSNNFPELKSRIISIENAGSNSLWVVTPVHGLLLVTVHGGSIQKVEHMMDRIGGPIRNIQSMFVEPAGRVWLATNRGVYGLDTRMNVVHFDTNDGLADDDVNTVFVHHDTLWAATVSGLSCLALRSKVESDSFASLVSNLRYQTHNRLVEIHILDSLATVSGSLLPPEATNIELDLSGLDFRSRGNLHFKIIQTELLPPAWWWTLDNLVHFIGSGLKGHSDTIFENSGTLRLGAYTAPGKYRIEVTAITASGLQSRLPDTHLLTIRPYWYQTIWFYLAIWLAIAYGIYRIYRARVAYREINATASVLQLQALQAQMNPHFIGNAINAIQQFMHPPNPEKTSEYISVFMRLLRRTMHFSEKTFVSFDDELSYVREYLLLTHLRFEDRFQYEIRGDDRIPGKTPVPSMLLQPLLENATLHGIAPEGNSILSLEFLFDGDRLRCILTDNGIGFKETQRQKKLAGIERVSKGLSMLHKKILTLNRLYDLQLVLEIQDISEDLQLPATGTRVILSYSLSQIWKATEKLPMATAAET